MRAWSRNQMEALYSYCILLSAMKRLVNAELDIADKESGPDLYLVPGRELPSSLVVRPRQKDRVSKSQNQDGFIMLGRCLAWPSHGLNAIGGGVSGERGVLVRD